jgi:hypothetical protein
MVRTASKMASVSGIFFSAHSWRPFADSSPGVEFGRDGLLGWELGVGVAFLGNQLLANLGSIEPRVQSFGAKLRINLTLIIHNRRNVGKEIGQMRFDRFAAACGQVVQADQAAFQFMRAFANRLTVPAKLAFGAPLPARAEFFDGSGHKQPPRATSERMSSLDEQRFERVGQIHYEILQRD